VAATQAAEALGNKKKEETNSHNIFSTGVTCFCGATFRDDSYLNSSPEWRPPRIGVSTSTGLFVFVLAMGLIRLFYASDDKVGRRISM
jgi:hypothetical protein